MPQLMHTAGFTAQYCVNVIGAARARVEWANNDYCFLIFSPGFILKFFQQAWLSHQFCVYKSIQGFLLLQDIHLHFQKQESLTRF